jgi:hypothetical protein
MLFLFIYQYCLYSSTNVTFLHLICYSGMVDPGEQVSVTVRREFMEEALDSGGSGASPEDLEELEGHVNAFFEGGKEIYKG